MKAEVFDRLFKIGKPFAMLVGVVGLFESQKRYTMFKENTFEIMYFNKRISYFKDYNDENPSMNPPFSSVYLCSKMLPDGRGTYEGSLRCGYRSSDTYLCNSYQPLEAISRLNSDW